MISLSRLLNFRFLAVFLAVAGVFLLWEVERPPMQSVQRGFRGTGMDEIYNPRMLAQKQKENVIPAYLPSMAGVGPKAGATSNNVQVLKAVSVGEFTRLMASMTAWFW